METKCSLTLKIIVNNSDDGMATVWQTEGLSRESVTDLQTMVGMIDNFKNNILLKKIETKLKTKVNN